MPKLHRKGLSKKEIPQKENTSWGSVAKWYDTYLEGTKENYQEVVIAPNLIRLVAPKKGMKILDLACGQGYFTRLFKEKGADVVGADIAPELIAEAKERSKGITYYATPAHTLTFAQGETFDVVSIVLAIQNIHNMQEVFAEVWRVLKPGGKFFIVINHPTFRIPKGSSWGYDPRAGVQYRRVDTYLSPSSVSIDMHPGKKNGPKTVSYHRSLQDFFKAFGKAGFMVTRLEEWISHKKSGKGPRQNAEDTARKEIPIFMMLEVQKGK